MIKSKRKKDSAPKELSDTKEVLPPKETWEKYSIVKIIRAPSMKHAINSEAKAKVIQCELMREGSSDAKLPDVFGQTITEAMGFPLGFQDNEE